MAFMYFEIFIGIRLHNYARVNKPSKILLTIYSLPFIKKEFIYSMIALNHFCSTFYILISCENGLAVVVLGYLHLLGVH